MPKETSNNKLSVERKAYILHTVTCFGFYKQAVTRLYKNINPTYKMHKVKILVGLG
jgi:hypothetical protein